MESTDSRVDRRREILGLQSVGNTLVTLVVTVGSVLPGFVRYLAAPFKDDGCGESTIKSQETVATFFEI